MIPGSFFDFRGTEATTIQLLFLLYLISESYCMKKCLQSYATLFILLLSVACNNDSDTKPGAATGTIQLSMFHVFNGTALRLNDTQYQNNSGEGLSITTFKYYLSNFKLKYSDGSEERLPGDYFLVDESVSASKQLILSDVKAGKITSIAFLVGVDSARNNSGVQSGALDPVHGMFWSWNSGYIMAKLEGQSDAANTPDHTFALHIGGFQGTYSVLHEIVLPVNTVQLNAQQEVKITLSADVAKWFDGTRPISLQVTSTVHVPGETAYGVYQNYSKMFSILSVSE
ncbi:hypothetical protein COR50_21115 [Chitinophaga caeni]|uniref:Copper-binding protein MbnP-like domain-containing protein n=2 Tax=Chitinophaga caeni TaxID=2029983 RepID=A0A291QZW9_9BACT|nr:hypothetical protein COR50_21115 [Chitinophaga caeni]